jgi:hypothetical protein
MIDYIMYQFKCGDPGFSAFFARAQLLPDRT